VEVVASLSQGRTAAAQCGFFTHKSVPVIFEPPCNKVDRNRLTFCGIGWGSSYSELGCVRILRRGKEISNFIKSREMS